MNILALSSALLSTTCFLLAIFILKYSQIALHRLWAFFNISVGIWGAGIFFASLSKTPESAFRYWQLAHCGGFFVSVFFYHVVHNFCDLKEKIFLRFVYAQAILFFLLNLFGVAGYRVVYAFDALYYVKLANFVYVFVTIFWFAPVIYGHIVLFMSFRHASGQRRNQMKYLFVSMLIGFSGGAQHFLPVYDINVYPYGNFLITIYTLIATYAIVKHRLMDIEVIIKNTLKYAILSFIVFGSFAMTSNLITNVFQVSEQVRWWLFALVGMLIAAVIRPLDTFLINVTDKYLFQKKFAFAQVLKDASQDIAWVTNLEDLTRKMLYVLIHKARTKHAAIYVRPTEHDRFELQGLEGQAKVPPRFFPIESPLISYLGEHQVPITRALIDESLSQARNNLKRAQLREVHSVMIELEAEVIVPSFLSGSTEMGIESHPFLRLQGFLVLGSKKSDEDYTQQDLDVLAAIAQEHTVSFEKIRLFDEYLKERETAERVNYTRTLKHETGNKLVGIESAAINLRKEFSGWFAEFKRQIGTRLLDTEVRMYDQLQAIVKKYAEDIERNGTKVRMTIDSVVGGLSGDHALKQVMDFRVPWETAKRNVKVDHDFSFDVKTEESFKIYGNVNSIEQIFENFFTNSCDAMSNVEEKLISLRGSCRAYEGKKVTWFEYWDAGPGVPEELFEKVFEQDFSTKPRPKTPTSQESGHGHGLYVCRKIVEDHGGKIWLEKRSEGGSKFVFWLPLQEGSAK